MCAHPEVQLTSRVIGSVRPDCHSERDRITGKCGFDGKLFELKWWRKLVQRCKPKPRYRYRAFTEEEKQRVEQRTP